MLAKVLQYFFNKEHLSNNVNTADKHENIIK